MTDCIIVGQGIGGTCLAHALLERGLNIKVFDNPEGHTASVLAAGVINPITGRRFVKTWKAEELLPLARKRYREIGEKLGISCIQERRILNAIDHPAMEENWALRTGDSHYTKYLGNVIQTKDSQTFKSDLFGEIFGAIQIDMEGVIKASAKYFAKLGIREPKVYKHDMVNSANPTAKLNTKHIIFAEGVHVRHNPLFKWLPNQVAKGEILVCRIPDLKTNDIIKSGVAIVPFRESDVYWVGSNYDWDNFDPTPTEKGRQALSDKLAAAIHCDFEVLHHWAGLRPTAKDRRPFVGSHPEFPNIHLLNGLGTKGASLAPYCAEILANHIASDHPIPDEVDILRYHN
jgi:glycine oxidase